MCISAPAGIAPAGIASAGITSAGIASGVVVSGLPCLKDCPATLPNLIGYNKGWFYGQTPNPDLNVHEKGQFHGHLWAGSPCQRADR